MRKPKGEQCLCTVCGLTFGGERAFDWHRTGSYANGDAASTRRCMSVKEMGKRGMVYNERRMEWQRPLRMPIPTATVAI